MDFDFKKDYILENEVVQLRPLEAADYDLLLEYSLNEPEIWQFNFLGARGADNLRIYMDSTLQQRQNEKEYSYIVYDKRTGKYAGHTRFYNFNMDNKILEIGSTWYGKAFQGTGLNKNCKYLLLQFAFESMGAERVGFGANNKNERSKNAMKSIGCKEEGVLRNFSRNAAGERIDIVVLGIIREEWFGNVKAMLANKITI